MFIVMQSVMDNSGACDSVHRVSKFPDADALKKSSVYFSKVGTTAIESWLKDAQRGDILIVDDSTIFAKVLNLSEVKWESKATLFHHP